MKPKIVKLKKGIEITAIIMLIAAVLTFLMMIPMNEITANAASENLIKNEITIELAEGLTESEPTATGYKLGLVAGKKYNIELTYNGDLITLTGKTIIYSTIVALVDITSSAEMPVPIKISDTDNLGIICQDGVSTTGEAANDFTSLIGTEGASTINHTVIVKSITEIEGQLNSNEIIKNVTGGFTNFLTGTGEGIANFFEAIFTDSEGNISIMAIVFLSLMGLGLASGVIRILLNRF